MNKTGLQLIEFDTLLSRIAADAHCDASRAAVLALRPLRSTADIHLRHEQIAELLRLSQQGESLGISAFKDLIPLLAKARPAGSVLEAADLAGFIPVLTMQHDISRMLVGREELPRLDALAAGMTGFPAILRVLKRSVDHEGSILDTASPLLADLREQIRRLDLRIMKKLEEMVRDERTAVFLQDTFITKRSGRWVIPVRMDSKGQVAGVVHDVSKSGETAFMEPIAIIQLANELENLVAEQKAEEIRILRELSSLIRNDADGIEAEFRTLVTIDMLDTIARFASALDMAIPEIHEGGGIRLRQARHPLLVLAFERSGSGRSVVPLDVQLGGSDTVMVITGSNAGGKTIAIKTIGLLVAMALSGMPIPASSASSVPLVHDLLADIGDEQSIEANLSTFAAHIGNIASILEQAGPRSLVLIDELGTGTDPEEGAALACAVLAELRAAGGLVFATTHLADIKGFVHRTGGMVNASMDFDRRTFSPLYRLRLGEPGQSYALETAQRYGLPERIIGAARAMLGNMKVEFDNLIADLNAKRAQVEEEAHSLAERGLTLEAREKSFALREEEAAAKQKDMLAAAYQEAADIVLETKRRMHGLIDAMKEKEKADRRALLKEVQAAQHETAARLAALRSAGRERIEPDDLTKGDTVFVYSLGRDATVMQVSAKDRRVRVQAGSIEVEVPLDGIGRSGRKIPAAEAESHTDSQGDRHTASRINLIGMRVDEALEALEPFLNDAALGGLPEVTVIHGFGTGALSRAVRSHLRNHPLVASFRGGEQSEGGGGVTVAKMK